MKKYMVTVNGNKYEVEVEEVNEGFSETSLTPTVKEEKNIDVIPKNVSKEKKDYIKGEKIDCPMPGKILKVNKESGENFKKGDVLFVLEAMKMENEIMAPKDGGVIEINVLPGDMVSTGDTLAVIE